MLVNKITNGFVIQVWDTEKEAWTNQQFVAGDQVDYENQYGEPVDPADAFWGMPEPYLPFDMVQPEPPDREADHCQICGGPNH